jgi:hypothetical protein
MKLFLNVNLTLTLTQIELQFSFGEFVCLFQFSFFLFSFDKLFILIFSFEYRDKGLTPEIPSNCPQKLVELMQMCWKKRPQQRPVSFLFVFFCFFIPFYRCQLYNLICAFLDWNVDRILKWFVSFSQLQCHENKMKCSILICFGFTLFQKPNLFCTSPK